MTRLPVAKTYKMFVGGAFVRSESNRTYSVRTAVKNGRPDADAEVVNIPRGTRKDVRDAVLAAKNAQHGWAGKTAYNRGQILYRLAEVMESRRDELIAALVRGGSVKEKDAVAEVDLSIDRTIWYAGVTDKISGLLAAHNPVSGPHFGFTVPEPTGLVAVIAPETPVLLGLVSTILPAIVSGNTVVALATELDPRTAVVWCECLATSDLPGGVVNVLTGHASEIASHLAKHREIFAMDVWGLGAKASTELAKSGADNVKRFTVRHDKDLDALRDEARGQGLGWVEKWLEMKTVWHPAGI
jgi:acyl-CoA reductase-like NAD-dependent aldehyde dehydrogenase